MPPLVLVVDDDPCVRNGLPRLLRAEGFEVATEADGSGALESVRLLRPDVVLLDIVMPQVTGLDVCRSLKADPDTQLIPIVLLTGLTGAEEVARGLNAGADDFLTKPAEPVELLARVHSLVRVKRYTDQLDRVESVLLTLARSIEGKDPYTEGHCERLSAYATQLGRRLSLSDRDIEALDRAGMVHDIGKVAVPDAILLKPGPLTEEEWKVVRMRPVTGEQICVPIHSFRLVLPIIRHHHERQDGSGYPDGLAGEEIPMTARVLQVVDVYDALTTERPYKPAHTSEEALKTLQAETARGWWDRDVVGEFGQLVVDGEDGS